MQLSPLSKRLSASTPCVSAKETPLKPQTLQRSDRVEIRFAAAVDTQQRLRNEALVQALSPKQNPTVASISTLLEKGADPNFQTFLLSEPDARGSRFGSEITTPLLEAIALGHPDIVTLLIQRGAHVNYPPSQDSYRNPSMPPLHKAAKINNPEMIQLLLKHQAKLEAPMALHQTALGTAARHWKPQAVEALIKAKANINHQDIFGRTPLHEACALYPASPEKVQQNAKAIGEVVQALVKAGANLTLHNRSDDGYDTGYTPIEVAVTEGNIPALEALLTFKPKLNQTDASGKTLLDKAMTRRWVDRQQGGDRMKRVIKILRDNGAKRGFKLAPKRLRSKFKNAAAKIKGVFKLFATPPKTEKPKK